MNVPYQIRLRQIQFVITTVDEDAFGVEKRSHGAVAQDGRSLQTCYQIPGHILENTGGKLDLHRPAQCRAGKIFHSPSVIIRCLASKSLSFNDVRSPRVEKNL